MIASPYFGTVLENLSNERVAYVTLAALYNISLDYEPVQRTLRQNGIFLAIMAMLEDPIFDISSMMFHLTGLLSSALEDYDVGQSPDTVLRTLLHYTTDENLDLEELGPLRDAVLLHLKDDYYRALLVKQNLFESLLVTILRSCGYKGSSIYGKAGISSTDEILWTERLKEEVEDFEDLQTSLLAAMRDLSSTPTFWEKYPFEHQMTTLWLSWLESGNSHLQLISCCFLSNMARAKVSWAERMLGAETKPLYTKLVELSLEDMGTRISLAALEFLLQLARPKSNRTIICTFEFLDKLSRIWTVKATTPGGVVRAQYASVAVLIGLISDCLSAALCLTELSEHATGRHSNYLSALLTCFEQISDNKVKIEIAKVIMLLCRHMIQVHKDSENPDSNRTDSSTNSYKDLLRSNCFSIGHVFLSPVAMVISQTENPGLQAQGFFALVIVARQDGGLDLVRELVQQSTVLESLAKAIAEKPVGSAATSPSADADLADRSFVKRSVHENARWLLREYVNREVSTHYH